MGPNNSNSFQRFQLYENRANFFMIGTNNDQSLYKILTIDRLKPSELDIREDPNTYNEAEYNELIEKIKEESDPNGGFNFVTDFYGIIGFIKFLGPYYMLLITERDQIGDIFGHVVYKPAKTKKIVVPSTSYNFSDTKNEDRYMRLFSMIDVTKDFYFSYTYNVMRSLQKNLLGTLTDENVYDSMFVWNDYLTRHLRGRAKSGIWTVPLVYGFFKQEKYSAFGNNFVLTLIGRRSRYFAGTRYLRRGVNMTGRVANDVETEQIVAEDVPNPARISSILQHRGSIPLFWSQETNLFNPKPDIILGNNMGYEATLLHFKHLEKRYGTPIIILNLIKKKEKRPRESLLRREFVKAIENINNQLPPKNQLQYLHWDVHMKPRSSPAVEVLVRLARIAEDALKRTGYFYSRVPSADGPDPLPCWSAYLKKHISDENNNSDHTNGDNTDDTETLGEGSQCTSSSSDTSAVGTTEEIEILNPESPMFQKGILRTNCIDCLDRTNVAQYAFGLVALWHQLHALGLVNDRYIDLDYPVARELMRLYEIMGDTLARQYGGSDAHNKIFSERRGHTKFLIRTHEFFRTIQRHYSNALMDANKQAAINLFLGYFEPQPGKPAIWEIRFNKPPPEDDQVLSRTASSYMRRAMSDGSIIVKNHSNSCPMGQGGASSSSTWSCVCTPSEAQKHFVSDNELATENEEYEESNFFDTSILYGQLPPMSSPIIYSPTRSAGDVNDVASIGEASTSESGENGEDVYQGKKLIKAPGFSDKFRYWVDHDELLGFY